MVVMMVINPKHLESGRAEALSLPCFFKLLHNGAYCSQVNVMTAKTGSGRSATYGEILSL